MAVGGFVSLVLELPTGGLADTIGRRPLLLVAGAVAIASTAVFVLADTAALFAVALVLQGVFRALDSGPLEAWFVDTVHAVDPAAPIERGLSRSGADARRAPSPAAPSSAGSSWDGIRSRRGVPWCRRSCWRSPPRSHTSCSSRRSCANPCASGCAIEDASRPGGPCDVR